MDDAQTETKTLMGGDAVLAAEEGDVVQFREDELTVSEKGEFNDHEYIVLEGPRGGNHREVQFDRENLHRPDDDITSIDLKLEVEEETDDEKLTIDVSDYNTTDEVGEWDILFGADVDSSLRSSRCGAGKVGRRRFELRLRPPEGRRIPSYPTGPQSTGGDGRV